MAAKVLLIIHITKKNTLFFLSFIIFNKAEEIPHVLPPYIKHISEIAYACGFSDPKYFSRCFKKLTGKSPSEYINPKNLFESISCCNVCGNGTYFALIFRQVVH